MSSKLKLVLGSNQFGSLKLSQDSDVHAVIDAFLARGYKEIDTASIHTDGGAEKAIGHHPLAKDRSKMVIATKVNPWRNLSWFYSFRKDELLKQTCISLDERLQVPAVDIFYLHAPDHNTPIKETLSACQQLYEEGKFKELGLSNYASWQVAEVYYICKENGWVLPTVYQGMYNPVTRMVEGELIPCLRNFGIRFYAYNPLAGGLLTDRFQYQDKDNPNKEGRFHSMGSLSKLYQDRFWRETVFEGMACVRKALDEVYGTGKVNMVSAAFRWMNHHSVMKPEYGDSIVFGVSCMEHLIANMDACEEGPLDQCVVAAFDEAWNLDKGSCALYYK